MRPPSNRIESLDLAKGLCISWVILEHSGVDIPIPTIACAGMPLFFILSGFFYKEGRMKDFIVNKVNRILIPFIAFYLIGYIQVAILKYAFPNYSYEGSVFDAFTRRQFYNGPLWFLLALFWCNIIFCIINHFFKNVILLGISSCLLAGLSAWGGHHNIFIPLMIDVGFTTLPFFYFGYLLKKYSIPSLNLGKYRKILSLFFSVVIYIVTYLFVRTFGESRCLLYNNFICGNVFSAYVIAAVLTISILLLCDFLGSIPIISYMGKYSLIALCTHYLIYQVIFFICNSFSYTMTVGPIAFITYILTLVTIPICVKYLPHISAQKNWIVIKDD